MNSPENMARAFSDHFISIGKAVKMISDDTTEDELLALFTIYMAGFRVAIPKFSLEAMELDKVVKIAENMNIDAVGKTAPEKEGE